MGGKKKKSEKYSQWTYERGERLPSALCWCAELSLEEVGEALSLASLEDLELGVTM